LSWIELKTRDSTKDSEAMLQGGKGFTAPPSPDTESVSTKH
jgi:hypothetical protein